MKCEDIYKECGNLALYGYEKKNGLMVYVDPFGCDLIIYYIETHLISDKIGINMHAFLGGREVCYCNSITNQARFVNGYWAEIVPEILTYEYRNEYVEQIPYAVNGTLLELCKMEAAKNRKILDKYRELCLSLVKKYGVKSLNNRRAIYELKKHIDKNEIRIRLIERTPTEEHPYYDEIILHLNKEIKFSFCWNCNIAGSIFDDKGEYFPGELEKILERLTEEL